MHFFVKSICRKIEEKLKTKLQKKTDKLSKNIVEKFLGIVSTRPICKKIEKKVIANF
jgi:hypothetical protein